MSTWDWGKSWNKFTRLKRIHNWGWKFNNNFLWNWILVNTQKTVNGCYQQCNLLKIKRHNLRLKMIMMKEIMPYYSCSDCLQFNLGQRILWKVKNINWMVMLKINSFIQLSKLLNLWFNSVENLIFHSHFFYYYEKILKLIWIFIDKNKSFKMRLIYSWLK